MKEIPLTRGLVALVDDADHELVSKFKWYAVKRRRGDHHAARKDGKKSVYMHRFLMGEPPCLVDHKDRSGVNNQRENLRLCNHSRNGQNAAHGSPKTSAFRGVNKSGKRWRATINAGPPNKSGYAKQIHLGYFDTDVEGARAYDAAAIRHFGEFAHLNFPEQERANDNEGRVGVHGHGGEAIEVAADAWGDCADRGREDGVLSAHGLRHSASNGG